MNISVQILLKRVLLLFGASMLTAIALDYGLRHKEGRADSASHATWPATLSSKVAAASGQEQPRPWNGGKPQPKVELSADLTHISGDLFEFTLQIESFEKCTDLTVRVKGLDGVTIAEEDGSFERNAPCAEAFATSVHVNVPKGTAGFVSAEIELHGGPGGTRSFSRAFPAENLPFDQPAKSATIDATAETVSNGDTRTQSQSLKAGQSAENQGKLIKMNDGGWVRDIEVE
jgi:hypothetical protein